MVRAAVGLADHAVEDLGTLGNGDSPVLSRAMSLEPTRRYQTAGEFARAFTPLVTGGKAELAELMARLFPTEMRKDSA